MEFDPHSVTQENLHELRAAAEQAWADDTRHPHYEGHPLPSAGQCHVTSWWLTKKLGGSVGLKNGHYFWVSPDRHYVIDLTGDQFAGEPHDMSFYGARLDEEDEGWTPTKEQSEWRDGPIVYKLASHPIYKGFRIKDPKTVSPRMKLFAQRADEAYGA